MATAGIGTASLQTAHVLNGQSLSRHTVSVQRHFGVLAARWHVLKRPLRNWHVEDLHDLMQCHFMLHNMIAVDGQGLQPHNKEEPQPNQSFALFGREEMTAAEAHADGLDPFSVRMAALDCGMQSPVELLIEEGSLRAC